MTFKCPYCKHENTPKLSEEFAKALDAYVCDNCGKGFVVNTKKKIRVKIKGVGTLN